MTLFAHEHIIIVGHGRSSVHLKLCRCVEVGFVFGLSFPWPFLVEGHRPRNLEPTQRLLGCG